MSIENTSTTSTEFNNQHCANLNEQSIDLFKLLAVDKFLDYSAYVTVCLEAIDGKITTNDGLLDPQDSTFMKNLLYTIKNALVSRLRHINYQGDVDNHETMTSIRKIEEDIVAKTQGSI